jgi:hypothetical protein
MPLRRPRLFALSLSLPLVAAVGLFVGAAQADDPKPCSAKSFKIAQVEAACKSGGQAAAKKMMKKATDKAKAAGTDINCKTCHVDLKAFALKGKDPVGDLKKWL